MSDEEIDMLAGEWGSALAVSSYDFNGNPTYGRTFTVHRFRAAVRAALEKQRIGDAPPDLIESGRRLVDGGPDDLLAGVE